jgi:DNA repair photolyase
MMQERGIPTVVWLTPVLPFINDTRENITAILNECVRTGVKGVIDFGMGLTLREGDRECYYAALDRHFPGMKERYIRQYGNAYELPSPNAKELKSIMFNICKDNGIISDPDDCFRFIQEFPDKYKQYNIFELFGKD